MTLELWHAFPRHRRFDDRPPKPNHVARFPLQRLGAMGLQLGMLFWHELDVLSTCPSRAHIIKWAACEHPVDFADDVALQATNDVPLVLELLSVQACGA